MMTGMMIGILIIQYIRARARLVGVFAGFVIAAGLVFPVLAGPAPREALPSSEAIEWLLETEATGSAAPWENSRSGYSGTVMITQTWHRADGTPCREYTVAAITGRTPTTLTGTGCRIGTGEWNLSEDAPAAMSAVGPAVSHISPAKKPREPAGAPPAAPVIATALVPPAPAIAPPAVPAPAGDGTDDTVNSTRIKVIPPEFIPATAEPKPVGIAASLPSRSDE